MADNTNMLCDEERIRKLIKNVFEEEFEKQEQNLAKINGDLEITMKEIKTLKNEVLIYTTIYLFKKLILI